MNETKSLRHFGLFMAFACFLLGAGIPLLLQKAIHPFLIILAVLFLLLGLILPSTLKTFRDKWIWLGEKLGIVNSRILFTILYLTLFSFIHLMFKIFGRDKFKRKWKAYDSTYVEKRSISAFLDPF